MNKMQENKIKDAEKLYIIIAGAVASGKTTLAKNIARAFGDCFYYDKDDLGELSKAAFACGHRKYDRHGKYFKKRVRNPEYDASEKITLKGLWFSNHVIQNAPYTGEIGKEAKGGESKRLRDLQDAVHKRGAKMLIVFVHCDRKTVKEHLIKRGKEDPFAYERDRYIYKDLDAFLDTQNLFAPGPDSIKHTDALFAFDAKTPVESFRELMEYLGLDSNSTYDPAIGKKLRQMGS